MNKFLRIQKTLSFSTYEFRRSVSKYDLIVIGGGSAGLSCAKESASCGAKVAVLDYVTPSPIGSKWGVGGTCVNVGCIPKKIMHYAAGLGQDVLDSKQFGWKIDGDLSKLEMEWPKLITRIQDNIKSINWTTKVDLKSCGVTLINGQGAFKDKNTIIANLPNKTKQELYGTNIVVAVGGRPLYPDIPGALDFGITSDDIFSYPKPPGKTLIIGAGYIALECACFLNQFKNDVDVMFRSVVLRHFDRQMSDLLKNSMEETGISFIPEALPFGIEKKPNNKLQVTWGNRKGEAGMNEYDTVIFAIGRKAATKDLQLNNAGLEVDPTTHKIPTLPNDQTAVSNIYALGDAALGRPELTPTAILSGRLLAKRLFQNSTTLVDYKFVPTTIYTSPLEYSCVGLSEEEAVQKHGEDNIEVYHGFYKPLELTVAQRNISQCYLKAISRREGEQRVIGMHYLGLYAGEIMQGYSVALNSGLTVHQLTNCVCIHPTIAEEFIKLTITKRSGLNPVPAACCS